MAAEGKFRLSVISQMAVPDLISEVSAIAQGSI